MKDAPFDSACVPPRYQGESVEKCHVHLSNSEDEGAAYSPAEDKPVSPRDMTHLPSPQRISGLSVNIMEQSGGDNGAGEGRGERKQIWRKVL